MTTDTEKTKSETEKNKQDIKESEKRIESLTSQIHKTKKNKGVIPPCPDERLRYVTASCGECYECRKQKQRAATVKGGN